MKNDYLWDKSGQDAEIEGLERSLEAFRFQPGTPPLLPVDTAEASGPWAFFRSLTRLRPAFAGTALSVVALVSAGIWTQTGPGRLLVANDAVSERTLPRLANLPTRPKLKPAEDPVPVNFGKEILFAPIPKATRIAYRPEPGVPSGKKRVRLTSEERDAYRQLMLALTITGSKLKEIKDKVNGTEDLTAERKTIK